MENIINRWELERKKQLEEGLANLKANLAKMHAAHQFTEDSTISYSWNGAGDSGDLYYDSYNLKSTSGDLTIEGSEQYFEDAWGITHDDLYNLLPGGWELNEGSCGTIILYPATGKITVSPSWLEYVESGTEEY